MKKILFIIERPPYKSENSRLAITHAMSCYLTDLHIDESVEPVLAFVGDGVLNCLKDQKAMEFYGITSTEEHIKNQLASDMKILVCKEDLEELGIEKEKLVDAKDRGASVSLNIVSFGEVLQEMASCNHIMFC